MTVLKVGKSSIVKARMFKQQLGENKRVVFFIKGSEVDEAKPVSEYHCPDSGLCIAVTVTQPYQDASFLPAAQPMITPGIDEPMPKGTVLDLVLWLVLGFFFNVVVLICVRLT